MMFNEKMTSKPHMNNLLNDNSEEVKQVPFVPQCEAHGLSTSLQQTVLIDHDIGLQVAFDPKQLEIV